MKKTKTIINLIIITFLFLGHSNCTIDSKEYYNNFKIKGIDISNQFEGQLKWNTIGEHGHFVILRAIRNVGGTSVVDAKFSKNWNSLANYKISRGAYIRFSPKMSAEEQFSLFKKTVTLKKGDLPPIIDVEDLSTMKEANKWMKLIKQYYHVDPILYDNSAHYEKIKDAVEKSHLWLYLFPGLPIEARLKSKKADFWQYKQNQRLDKFQENADLNVFLGDSIAFKKILIR